MASCLQLTVLTGFFTWFLTRFRLDLTRLLFLLSQSTRSFLPIHMSQIPPRLNTIPHPPFQLFRLYKGGHISTQTLSQFPQSFVPSSLPSSYQSTTTPPKQLSPNPLKPNTPTSQRKMNLPGNPPSTPLSQSTFVVIPPETPDGVGAALC